MYRHLPSLNALRAFECAARHGSFTRAAEELCVTQGAVSRQIRKLEEQFDRRLFSRTTNTLSLTESGRELAPAVTEALTQLDRAAERLLRDVNVLRLQVMPTFAVRWLMPRLPDFAREHPRIDVRVTITLHPARLDSDSFDAGLLYGDGDWPGCHADCLARECLAPVSATGSLETSETPQPHAALSNATLLHTTTDRRDWPWWLEQAGIELPSCDKGPAFETLDMAVRAAEAGHGVALADLSLIAEDLHAGRLKRLAGQPRYTGRGVYCVYPEQDRPNEALMLFRNWLLQTAPITSNPEQAFLESTAPTDG